MKQNDKRFERIADVYDYIEENEPIGIEGLSKRFPDISLKTLKEYVKVLFNMELLISDSYKRYSVIEKGKNIRVET